MYRNIAGIAKRFPNARRALLLLAALFVLLAFHGINNYRISRSDLMKINPDMDSYFSFVNEMISELSRPFPRNLSVIPYTINESWKPPVFYSCSLPFVWLKRDIAFASLVNIVFLGISLAAIYGTGCLLFNRAAGVFAALLFSFLPSVFSLSRVFYIETALTAVTALTLYLFVLNRFRERPYAVLAGIVMGAGFLTKQAYLVFVVPFLLYFFLQPGNRKSTAALKNFFLSLVIAAGLAAVWYLPQDRFMPETLFHYWYECGTPAYNYGYYATDIFRYQLGPVLTAVLTGAAIVLGWRRKFFLSGTVIAVIVFFSLSKNEQARFILPLFPVMALIIAGGVFSLGRGSRVAAAALGIFAAAQYVCICYFPHAYSRLPWLSPDDYSFANSFDCGYGIFALQKDGEDWKTPVALIAASISVDEKNNIPVTVLAITDAAAQELHYQMIVRGMRVNMPGLDLPTVASAEEMDRLSREWIENADYVVTDTFSKDLPFEKRLQWEFIRNKQRFRLIRSVALPGEKSLLLYGKTGGGDGLPSPLPTYDPFRGRT